MLRLLRFVAAGMAAVLLAVGCAENTSEEPPLQSAVLSDPTPAKSKNGDWTEEPPLHSEVPDRQGPAEKTWEKQAREAAEVCSADREVYPSSCGPAVWKVCHTRQHETKTPKIEAAANVLHGITRLSGSMTSTAIQEVDADEDIANSARFLCDAAVIAEVSELAFALAYRYGNEYYQFQFGWHDRYPALIYPFYLFHESVGYWRSHLKGMVSCSGCGQNDILSPIDTISFPWLVTKRHHRFNYSFREMSTATLSELVPLHDAIRELLSRYGYNSSGSSLPPLPVPPALSATQPTGPSVTPSEVPQVCEDAVAAARLDASGWETDIQLCQMSAEMCDKDPSTDVLLRERCSSAALAADFERLWQQLPSICIAAGRTTLASPEDDPCQEAAEELCYHPHRQYLGFSIPEIPDNPVEDFTCAAARSGPAIKVCFEISGARPAEFMVDRADCLVSTDMISARVWLSDEGEPTSIDEPRISSVPGWIWHWQPELEPEYILELFDSSGEIVLSEAFRFNEIVPEPSHPDVSSPVWQKQGVLEISVPDPPEYSGFAVKFKGREIAEFQRSPNAPRVSIAQPAGGEIYNFDDIFNIAWTARDFDGDKLQQTAYYSVDGGATYTPKPLDDGNLMRASDLKVSNQVRIRLYVSDGTRTAFAETPDFTITSQIDNCTIVGSDGDDVLNGTSGDDVICGLGGDDTIDGKAGNDIIDAGPGDDTAFGGSGDDRILGRAGNDTIFGHQGEDILYGGGGDDTIYGNDGADKLYGETGNDTLQGDKGIDTVYGGPGDDISIRNGLDILDSIFLGPGNNESRIIWQ